jgi:hypothetical protein
MAVAQSSASRCLSTTSASMKWTGDQPGDHVTNDPDGKAYNVRHDASKEGREERASGESESNAISEKDGKGENAKAKEDHPEAPGPVIGMNDERGGVCFQSTD